MTVPKINPPLLVAADGIANVARRRKRRFALSRQNQMSIFKTPDGQTGPVDGRRAEIHFALGGQPQFASTAGSVALDCGQTVRVEMMSAVEVGTDIAERSRSKIAKGPCL